MPVLAAFQLVSSRDAKVILCIVCTVWTNQYAHYPKLRFLEIWSFHLEIWYFNSSQNPTSLLTRNRRQTKLKFCEISTVILEPGLGFNIFEQ